MDTTWLCFSPHFLDAVVAIGNKDKEKISWVASAFFYGSFTSKVDDKQQKLYRTYLVSNRHVFEALKDAYVRVNPKEAKPPTDYQLQLTDENGQKKWFGHPNPKVDIAATPVNMELLRKQGMEVAFFTNDDLVANCGVIVTKGDRR